MTIDQMHDLTPAQINAEMRKHGRPTHLGPRLPAAEAPTATSRARAAIAALYTHTPAPKWGKRRA